MITSAANDFADALLNKSKEHSNNAAISALSYARGDDKNEQLNYRKHTEMSELYRKIHQEACAAMHAIEREMLQRVNAEKEKGSTNV